MRKEIGDMEVRTTYRRGVPRSKDDETPLGRLRREAGFKNQQELADRLEVSLRSVQNWERCWKVPEMANMQKLAEALHVSTGTIYSFFADISQIDRIEMKINLLIALQRGQDLDEEAWTAVELALGLDDPRPERLRHAPEETEPDASEGEVG